MYARVNKIFIFLFSLIILLTIRAYTQDPNLSQPWSLNSTLNPALYGNFNDEVKVGLGFSGQTSDLGMVNHQYAYVESKFEKQSDPKGRKFGMGVSYYQYNNASSKIISPLNAGFYTLGGSFHRYISNNGVHSMSIGSQITYANGKANLQGALYDPNINGGGFRWNAINTVSGNEDKARYIDLNAGVNYKYDNDRIVLESGLSIYHILRPKNSVFNNDISAIRRRFVFHNKVDLYLSSKKRIEISNITWLQGSSDPFTSSFNQLGILIKNAYRPVNKFYIDYGMFTRSLKTLMPYFLASTGTGLDVRLSHEFPIGFDKKYTVKRTELSLCYTIPGNNSVRDININTTRDVVNKKSRKNERAHRVKEIKSTNQKGDFIVTAKKDTDRDGDGVMDSQDNCPDIPGSEIYQGCPIPHRKIDNESYKNPDDYYKSIAENGLQKSDTIFYYVFFDKNSTTLYSKSFDMLNGVISFMKIHPEYICHLSGHAFGEGDDEYTMTMSHHRANSVKKYLISYNIAEGRISTNEFGRNKPIIINNEALDWMNRRVEVKLIKKP